ncbi:MAG: hypothetical protein LAT61_08475 [Alcanivorax sp.]|nr:hypothetical protein [Alcanivorax sp.]
MVVDSDAASRRKSPNHSEAGSRWPATVLVRIFRTSFRGQRHGAFNTGAE